MKRPLTSPSSAARLPFGNPERSEDGRSGVFLANVDGASRGNPGPASYAVILRAPDGSTRFEIGKYLGRATNNVAEYYALITALDYASTEKITRLRVRSDSELLVRQMEGRYKVKSPDLRPLHERAQKLARGFAYFAIEHVPREQNREADALANVALDRTTTISRASATPAAISAAMPAPAVPVVKPEGQFEARAAPSPRAVIRASATAPGSVGRGHTRIRARYSAGALHPLEVLDLDEGDIVEIQVEKPARKTRA